MDRKLFDAIMKARARLQTDEFWDEYDKKFNIRQEQYEREVQLLKPSIKELQEPFTL
jgi:hypothetical protein